ncbi:DivIVA domain-containing protein [Micromonospora zhanjiangensis]|uniref:Cell wall synthesis protein Wag31 n=1 Tax=Micromonospora zhanjiangensis TaxID=1522057 RepID=A0ABV8KLE5_9ACTN
MIYKSWSDRLAPYQVRSRVFGTRWRGLDPDQVYAFLGEVADEIARLEREATTSHAELVRVRQGLRLWKERHNGCRFTEPWLRMNSRRPQ